MVFQDNDDREGFSRYLRAAVPLFALAALAALVWWFATQQTGVTRQNDLVSTLLPVELPPPPPPKVQPVEPPKPVEQQIQTSAPPPPNQPPAANDAITQNADAQDGSDTFNIGAGNGGGLRGSGLTGAFNRGAFNTYLSQAIQRAIKDDPALGGRYFRVRVDVWLSSAGKITRVALKSSTGSNNFDQQIAHVLTQMPALGQAPPQPVLDTLPIELSIDLRKAL